MSVSRIACPYCCTVQTFPENYVCRNPNCNQYIEQVPEKYIRYAREESPVYLAVVGMSAHGKTTYLHSLVLAMDNLGKISRRSFLEALDDYTLSELQNIRAKTAKREKTSSTQVNAGLQQPLIFGLNKFMTDERHTMVIYDLAGESFNERADIQLYAAPLKLAQTIWFMVSLHDLEHENTAYSTIADLFNVYITGMERAEASPRGRNLHVIYTKADKLTNQLDKDVLKYIREDPYTNLAEQNPRELKDAQFELGTYSAAMSEVNKQLEEFTEYDVQGGIAFLNMAEDYGMNLSFSINTAIGRDHTPNNTMIDYRAYRVIDPLVHTLNVKSGDFVPDFVPTDHKQGIDSGLKKVVLILDTGFSSKGKIYGLNLPAHFFTELSKLGEVSTYYVGTLEPMTQSGIEPSSQPPSKEYHPLIGPILDQLQQTPHIVFLTCQNMLDMLDYHSTEWHERLAIVTFDNLYEVRRDDIWPRSIVFDRTRTPGEQVKEIVNKLFYASR